MSTTQRSEFYQHIFLILEQYMVFLRINYSDSKLKNFSCWVLEYHIEFMVSNVGWQLARQEPYQWYYYTDLT